MCVFCGKNFLPQNTHRLRGNNNIILNYPPRALLVLGGPIRLGFRLVRVKNCKSDSKFEILNPPIPKFLNSPIPLSLVSNVEFRYFAAKIHKFFGIEIHDTLCFSRCGVGIIRHHYARTVSGVFIV